MNNRADGVVNFLFGKELIEIKNQSQENETPKIVRSTPSNKVNELVKPIGDLSLPDRWKSTAKAMANFRERGMDKDAAKLHKFMASEIKKQSHSPEDYEHLYNMWSKEVSNYIDSSNS